MQEKTQEQLNSLRGTANGEALKTYLDEEIKKMQDINGIKTLKELLAKQEATKILERIFRFLDVKQNNNIKSKYN